MRNVMYFAVMPLFLFTGCSCSPEAQSVSGVKMASVEKVDMNSLGHTVEQQNLIDRIKADNEPGTIKHLYVISPYSGQTLLYSPVKGKVTSSGKRLSPKNIAGTDTSSLLPSITVGGHRYNVNELTNEDGTYGTGDAPYLFWTTPNGQYHQFFLNGGAIVHISDQPLMVKNVVITVDGIK